MTGRSVWRRYRRYLESPPERVVEWRDPPTGARGWLVINSLRGGAAGGGTRMRPGLDLDEAVYLAKTMELKFAYSGPPIGGGKSAIDFDPDDPRRREVLERWFESVAPHLDSHYGTAGDLNVDAERDVASLCSSLGLRHPQQGVVRGHLDPSSDELDRICRRLREGIMAPVGRDDDGLGLEGKELCVSDLITGYGVARAAVHLRRLRDERLAGDRVVVEGFGNVGGAACLYLARAGARIVAVVDRDHAVVAPEGLGPAEIEELLAEREGGALPPHPLRVEGEARQRAYETPADVFVPAAVSGSVDRRRLERLRRTGVRTLVCAANQPFREGALGSTSVQQAADEAFEVVVDAVGGLGMARALYCLMTGTADGSDDPCDVFEEVDTAVRSSMEDVLDQADGRRTGLLAAGLEVALDRVGAD
ncbi:MAG: Glu/Leu/Phe/Val dehydrogenase dimerization domain-containing protein [Gemmatimonadota bacterium]